MNFLELVKILVLVHYIKPLLSAKKSARAVSRLGQDKELETRYNVHILVAFSLNNIKLR